jgi:hypothetical protein
MLFIFYITYVSARQYSNKNAIISPDTQGERKDPNQTVIPNVI